jgi:regulator of replication initiation timing
MAKTLNDDTPILLPPSKLSSFNSQVSRVDNYHKQMHDTVVSLIAYTESLTLEINKLKERI